MENKSAKRIFWEKTKKPLVFIVVSLAAAFALQAIKGLKEGFDNEQKAPFVVYADTDAAAVNSKSVHSATASNLCGEIAGVECSKNSDSKDAKDKKIIGDEKIISEGIAQIQYQEFKNKNDVLDALSAVVLNKKASDLRSWESQRDAQLKQKSDLTLKRTNDLNELIVQANDTTKTVDVLKLCPSVAAKKTGTRNQPEAVEKSVCTILNTKIKISDQTRMQPLSELTLMVTEHYDREEKYANARIGDFEEALRKSGENYQIAVQKIYTAFKGKQKLFNDLYEPVYTNSFWHTVLDEKSGLNVVYLLAVITLMAIIVFALLYVVLMPLKHVFFLSSSAETITGKAKDFIKIREAASAGAAARNIAATVAAFGIGAAVLTSASPLKPEVGANGADGTSGANGLAVAGANPKSAINQTRNNFKTTYDNSQAIEELSLDVIAIKTTVTGIETQIKSIPRQPGAYIDRRVMDGRTFPTVYQPDNGTIAALTSQIEGLNSRIGILGTNERSTLFNQLKTVSDNIGVDEGKENLVARLTNIQNVADNINLTANDIKDDTFDLNERTFFISEKADEINEAADYIIGRADTINETTVDTRRSNLGRDGRSFYKQFLTLFTGERYMVTPGAIDALEKAISPRYFPALKSVLEKLQNEPAMDVDKLMNQLETLNIDKETRKTILRILRVARY